jgi:hypothetical protein
MTVPSIQGEIERRLLVNYRVDPAWFGTGAGQTEASRVDAQGLRPKTVSSRIELTLPAAFPSSGLS